MFLLSALLAGLATAGLSAGATAISNSVNRSFNAEQAQVQRDWEERMSNTAYQRSVEDMRAAGLNPYLMYTGGQGPASTPTSAPAAYNTAARPNIGADVYGLVKSVESGSRAALAYNAYKLGYYSL